MANDTHRVLVVDDELKICQNCAKILSKTKCEVEYALNGYDALKMMDSAPFDVVITDLKMTSMGGMELLRRVKKDFPETIVIVITGYSSVSSAFGSSVLLVVFLVAFFAGFVGANPLDF